MQLVLDANILFSALIKNSFTAEILFDENLKIYAPEFIITEFFKYEEMILKKTKRTREEFIFIMHTLQEIITIMPKEEYSKYLEKARSITPDENDDIYFALALKLRCAIWSNDKELKNQKEVEIYSTKEIIEFI